MISETIRIHIAYIHTLITIEITNFHTNHFYGFVASFYCLIIYIFPILILLSPMNYSPSMEVIN